MRITQLQPDSAAGFTHASSVMPVVRSSEALSATLTEPLLPLNASALPNLPALAQLAPPSTEPILPLPERSPVDEPLPSLKP